MGGDPNPSRCLEVIHAVLRGGADILEIGVPFSDPIADGRSVQAAGVRALASGTRPTHVLRLAAQVKKTCSVPIVLMSYFNPILARGTGEFFDSARKSGVDGIIVPDLPLEEAEGFGAAARARGVDTILLASPTTTGERMEKIVANGSGFLYLVSVLGVTGARDVLKRSTVKLIKFTKGYTSGRIPLAVGFGISKPEHVAEVIRAGADAAIVGSAIVDLVGEFGRKGDSQLAAIEAFVRSLKDATRVTR